MSRRRRCRRCGSPPRPYPSCVLRLFAIRGLLTKQLSLCVYVEDAHAFAWCILTTTAHAYLSARHGTYNTVKWLTRNL